jgi:phosphoserine aminotransferase
MKKHNFTSGPAILPPSVFQQAAAAVTEYQNSGLSILEISHRDKLFLEIIEGAQALVKELYNLGNDYEVLFMQGGASAQFALIPMNFLSSHETASYIDTGVWSDKAIKEAKLFGNVSIAGSSKEQQYSFIPKQLTIDNNARYLHLTTNNTIYGSQFHYIPETNVPLVADMSSDIFSRPWDARKFDLIYAGAQKNAGAAGTTIVIIKKDFLKTIHKSIPMIFDYRKHADNQSLYNTPSVFAVYVSYLTLQWIKAEGGLAEMEKRNKTKAELLYAEIDRNTAFRGTVAKEDRSLMNATFVLNHTEHEEKFAALAKAAGIVGLKGHRLVGGFRASLYNALPLESVQVLIEVMKDFEKQTQ